MKLKMIVLTAIFAAGSIAMQETAANHHDEHEPNGKEHEHHEMDEKHEHHENEHDEAYSKATFFVRGNCNMCKNRIEDALDEVEGVKEGTWDVESSQATVTFDEEKVSEEKTLHQAVANAGHRTNNVDADEEAYNDLPACCLDPDDQQ